ncbi:hypothetical protein JCM9534A_62210 [Catenuloplanes indicus JCM 9534]
MASGPYKVWASRGADRGVPARLFRLGTLGRQRALSQVARLNPRETTHGPVTTRAEAVTGPDNGPRGRIRAGPRSRPHGV